MAGDDLIDGGDRAVVGTASAERGERRVGVIPVALPGGERLEVACWVVRGREDGPVLYAHSTLHGNEISGIEVIRRVVARLDPRTLRGTLIAVPVANPLALHWRRHHYLQGPEEAYQARPELDIDHFWPGDAEGTHVQRLAHALWQDAVRHATHVLDMHTWNRWQAAATTVRAWHEPSLALAKAFGLWVQRRPDEPLVSGQAAPGRAASRQAASGQTASEQAVPGQVAPGQAVPGQAALGQEASGTGSVTATAIRHGKAACSPNFTGQWDVFEPEVRRGVAGLLNVLRALEMLPGGPIGAGGGTAGGGNGNGNGNGNGDRNERRDEDGVADFGRTRNGIYAAPPVFSQEELVTVEAPAAGLFLPRVRPEQQVRHGQILGLLAPHGALRAIAVRAPLDGHVHQIGATGPNCDVALPPMMPLAATGARVARLLPTNR